MTEFDKKDFDSETWRKLKAFYEARLEQLRRDNDSPMNEDARNQHLGKIAECKYFLNLDKPPPFTED